MVIVSMSPACDCNSEGAYRETCAKFGGQCECKPNVIVRCCDSCAPLTYGFGPNGCTGMLLRICANVLIMTEWMHRYAQWRFYMELLPGRNPLCERASPHAE